MLKRLLCLLIALALPVLSLQGAFSEEDPQPTPPAHPDPGLVYSAQRAGTGFF